MKALRHLLAGLLLAALVSPGDSFATSSGAWHLARPETSGCNCHGPGAFLPPGAYPTAVPLLVVHGLPERYTPGERYDLSVAVIGPLVPFAGFNLEVAGGVLGALSPLVPEAGLALTGEKIDECEALADDGRCGTCSIGETGCVPSCEVRVAEECPVYGPENPDCACAAEERGTHACRPCSDSTIVSMQATHSAAAVIPTWSLRWTAPGCGFGPVRFYLVGNSVNGNDADDAADLWGRWPEPRVVMPDDSPCSP